MRNDVYFVCALTVLACVFSACAVEPLSPYRVSHKDVSAREMLRTMVKELGISVDHHRTASETDVWLSEPQLGALVGAGLRVSEQKLVEPESVYAAVPVVDAAEILAGGPAVPIPSGWNWPLPSPVYRDYINMTNFLNDVQTQCPSIAQVYSAGKSVQGRDLWVVKMTANVAVQRRIPQFKYVGNMHGDEVIGREMLLNLINLFCIGYSNSSAIQRLLNYTEIHIMPSMNPDGYELRQRGNANGVDLNRNFPDQYRDPINSPAGREPEVQAVMAWHRAHAFVVSANLHGGALVANYPFDGNRADTQTDSPTPDDLLFRQLALNYSLTHPVMHDSSEFASGITNGAEWYTLYGGMQDWNYVWGNDYEITLELSDVKWPPAAQLPTFWAQNAQALMAYIGQVHCGFRGTVVDEQGNPMYASVRVAGIDHVIYSAIATGDFYRPLSSGIYSVTVSAPGFLDKTFSIQSYRCVPENATTVRVLLQRETLPIFAIVLIVVGAAMAVALVIVALVFGLRKAQQSAEREKVFRTLEESEADWSATELANAARELPTSTASPRVAAHKSGSERLKPRPLIKSPTVTRAVAAVSESDTSTHSDIAVSSSAADGDVDVDVAVDVVEGESAAETPARPLVSSVSTLERDSAPASGADVTVAVRPDTELSEEQAEAW